MKKFLTGLMIAAVMLTSACGTSVSDSKQGDTTQQEETSAEEESSQSITSFDDVNTDAVSLIALGNSDVPVGQYAEEIFTSLGFWDSIQSKISFGTNVKEVLSQVKEGAVDCGVVYATDAATSDGVKVICAAPEGSLKSQVLYPAAMVKGAENESAAKAFLDFLLTDDAKSEFEKVGFKIAATEEPKNVTTEDSGTLSIFAAASLTESITEVGKLFNEVYPNIDVVINLDSSGTLEKQIVSGASADVFISASQKQMNALNDEGMVDESTRFDILENEVVLIVPEK